MEGLADRCLDVGKDTGDVYGGSSPSLASEGISKVAIAGRGVPGHFANVIAEQVGVRPSTGHAA